MSSDGSRPARIEWADSISTPTRFGSTRLVADRQDVADRRQVGLVHRLVGLRLDDDADVLVVLEQRVDARRADAAYGVDRVLGLADVRALAGQPEDDVRCPARGRCRWRAWSGRWRTCARPGRWRCSRRRWSCGSSHSRGATNSAKSPSSVEHLLHCFASALRPASADFVSTSGTTSSSWNCTPSKPSFLYSLELLARTRPSGGRSGRTGRRPRGCSRGRRRSGNHGA